MKLKSLNADKEKKGVKSKSPPTENVNLIDNPVSFNKGDIVVLKPNVLNYSSDLKKIAGLNLEVERCFNRDLGEGVIAEILYLVGRDVKNPYLSNHFKKVQ